MPRNGGEIRDRLCGSWKQQPLRSYLDLFLVANALVVKAIITSLAFQLTPSRTRDGDEEKSARFYFITNLPSTGGVVHTNMSMSLKVAL